MTETPVTESASQNESFHKAAVQTSSLLLLALCIKQVTPAYFIVAVGCSPQAHSCSPFVH